MGNGVVDSAADTGSANINLTERQKSVLERLGRGDSNKAIARTWESEKEQSKFTSVKSCANSA